MIFLDTNKNNTYDKKDKPIENVTIYFEDIYENILATEETDSDGKYCLSNAPVGSVRVSIDTDTLPENLVQVIGEEEKTIIVKTNKENWVGRDGFALKHLISQTSKVCGIVFLDINKNSIYDKNDKAIKDVSIYFEDANEEILAVKETNSEGKYCLSNAPIGPITVGIETDTLPKNLVQVIGEKEKTIIVKANEENWIKKDGFALASFIPRTGKISGVVFLDTNKNNTYDKRDKPIENVTIYFEDIYENILAIEETDENGKYCLSDAPIGSVTIIVDTNTLPKHLIQVIKKEKNTIMVKVNKENRVDFNYICSHKKQMGTSNILL